MNVKKNERILKLCLAISLVFCSNIFAADCVDVFPDGLSSSSNNSSITLNFNSMVVGSPDNILATTDFVDNAGTSTSCNGVSCTASNTVAETIDYNTFPNGQPDINLGFAATATVSPGNYDELTLGSEAELTMEPGFYSFRGDVSLGFQAKIIVSAPGTVFIRARRTFTTNAEVVINSAGGDRYLAIFARNDVTLGFQTQVNGIIYSREDIILGSEASVTGAITSRRDIVLNSPSTVTFNSTMVSNTDFDGLCTNTPVSVLPAPIAEWRLDEFTWRGTAGEVLDSSGNNLHGNAVDNGGLPTTLGTNPVVAGSPGTCYYGDFDQTSDGYVEISDPGNNSILDLDDEFTVAVWVYALSYPNSDLATIVSKDENFEFHFNTSGRIFWWWGGGDRSLTSSSTVSLDAWHHIAITFKSGEQVIYIDGVADATHDSTAAITVNNDSIFFGTDLAILGRRLNGFLDEIKIYDQALTAAQVNTVKDETRVCGTPPSLASFTVSVGANASVCEAQEVTVTAYDSVGDIFTEYVGTFNLSTSRNHGDWSSTGTASDAYGNLISIGSDLGTASYTFNADGDDEGIVRLNLSNKHAETLTITATDSAIAASGTSSAVTFSENAFSIEVIDSLSDDVVAGRDHQFRASVLRQDPTTGECGIATNYNNTSSKVYIARSVNDPSGASPTLNNADNSASITLQNNAAAAELLTFPFVSGVANFSLSTTDVGEYSLEFLDDSGTFSDTDILGSSSLFTVRPFGFYIDVDSNPKSNSASGSVFTAAGDDFTVSVTAVAWSALDDVDNNGIPDGHNQLSTSVSPVNYSDLSNNFVLQSFGNEGTPAEVRLSSTLILPAIGNDPGLLSSAGGGADGRILDTFVGGASSTSSVYFPEVGIIDIEASLNASNYLSASLTATNNSRSRSGYVGRFTPDYFSLASSTITQGCEASVDYSYMSEAFSFSATLEAKNSRDDLTQNYKSDFSKLITATGGLTSGNVVVSAIDSVVPTLLSARLSFSNIAVATSEGESAINLDLSFSRGSVPDGPFNQTSLGLNVSDGDGIELSGRDLDSSNDSILDSVNLGNARFRFGRLRLDGAFGPETANLPVTFLTEYWAGIRWTQNLDDNCTNIRLGDISYPSGTIEAATNRIVTVGSSDTSGSYAFIDAGNVSFTSGDAGHFFTAPGAGNTGSFSVDIDVTNTPWLRFDWNQDGDYNDLTLPTADYTFGQYRGHDRLIYWQEVFQ